MRMGRASQPPLLSILPSKSSKAYTRSWVRCRSACIRHYRSWRTCVTCMQVLKAR